MADAHEQFLRSGLSRYAEARATVDAYEFAIKTKMEHVAGHAVATYKVVSSPKVDRPNFTKAVQSGRAGYVDVAGKVMGKSVTWQLGIWWQDPADGAKTAVYAEYCEGPAALTAKWTVVPTDGKKWHAYPGGLHLVVTEADDIDEAFTTLLAEFERQLLALAAKSA
jgi:hypothetical protein